MAPGDKSDISHHGRMFYKAPRFLIDLFFWFKISRSLYGRIMFKIALSTVLFLICVRQGVYAV